MFDQGYIIWGIIVYATAWVLSLYQHTNLSSRHLSKEASISAEQLVIITGVYWIIGCSIVLIFVFQNFQNIYTHITVSDHSFFIVSTILGTVGFSIPFCFSFDYNYSADQSPSEIQMFLGVLSYLVFVPGTILYAQFGWRFSTLPMVEPGLYHLFFSLFVFPIIIIIFSVLFVTPIHDISLARVVWNEISNDEYDKNLPSRPNQNKSKKVPKLQNISGENSVKKNFEINEYGETIKKNE